MTFKILKSNNIDIRAKIEGSGPLIVLVHGCPESWYSWRHQIPLLAEKGYTVAAIDVRGYGGSSKPYEVEAYSMRELTKDVIGVIDALDFEKAILIGHDWGGPIVWNTAILNEKRISAVLALSVPFFPRRDISSIDLFVLIVPVSSFGIIEQYPNNIFSLMDNLLKIFFGSDFSVVMAGNCPNQVVSSRCKLQIL